MENGQQHVIIQQTPNKTLVQEMSQLGMLTACALHTELPADALP